MFLIDGENSGEGITVESDAGGVVSRSTWRAVHLGYSTIYWVCMEKLGGQRALHSGYFPLC